MYTLFTVPCKTIGGASLGGYMYTRDITAIGETSNETAKYINLNISSTVGSAF